MGLKLTSPGQLYLFSLPRREFSVYQKLIFQTFCSVPDYFIPVRAGSVTDIVSLGGAENISQIDLARALIESNETAKAMEILVRAVEIGNEEEKHEARLLYMQIKK